MSSTGASDGVEYPFGGPRRVIVPSEYRNWNMPWFDYKPPTFTIPMILKGDKPWADPDIGHPGFAPRFNVMDCRLNRTSNAGLILTNRDGFPLNPMGRTGIRGRGSLGRWGPNHAADCIVTRFKTDLDGKIVMNEEGPAVEFIGIRRQDGGGLAIPGGMTEPGEEPIECAKREFKEEVIGEESEAALDPMLSDALFNLFQEFTIVDKCYVDDRRNTDNAWIETFAVNFHIPGAQATTNALNTMKFKSGSDAKEAFWVEFQPNMKLYASHAALLKKAVEKIHEKYKV